MVMEDLRLGLVPVPGLPARLELTPTHPDRAGGLGFLAWGQASFAPILAAVSSVLSGSFAGQVLYAGESVNGLKYHLVVFVALSLGFLLAPLLVFSRQAGSMPLPGPPGVRDAGLAARPLVR